MDLLLWEVILTLYWTQPWIGRQIPLKISQNQLELWRISWAIVPSDVWRFKFPHNRAYSFFSNTHRTYTRIDYVLLDNRLLPMG